MAHDVFISHSAKDKPVADAVCATLEADAIRCWIAPRDVPPGADWAASIVEAIHESRAMVLIFSSNSNSSDHIKREVTQAASVSIPIIPLRIEDVAPKGTLEYYLATTHWLDAFTGAKADHLGKLVNVVQIILGKTAKQTSAAVQPVLDPPPPPASGEHAAPKANETIIKAAAAIMPVAVAFPVAGNLALRGLLWWSKRTRNKN